MIISLMEIQKRRKEEIIEAAKLAGAHEFISQLKDGI